ncbi:hypothetical protein BCON_0079g00040 [Botryotinia convoluta]|uniref:Uncharacterized protein n=1 Tax=Botryotinia convoluta TaxID=54673 RepID=A0A4Z1IBI0_9HELO|nr:hypothetical protein BCON_0079g00040 [Botryotinia convoluta]
MPSPAFVPKSTPVHMLKNEMLCHQINITVTPELPSVVNGLAVIGLVGGLDGPRDFVGALKAVLETIGRTGQAEFSYILKNRPL